MNISEKSRKIAHHYLYGSFFSVKAMTKWLAIATMIGVIVGVTVSFLICINTDITFSLNTFAIALGVSFSAAVGIIFGWAPARKASNLNPIDALRSM